LISFTGEFGLSSPISHPPGSFSTLPSNSHMAMAAPAASGLAPSFNSTFKFKTRSFSVLRYVELLSHLFRIITIFAVVRLYEFGVCLTWPKAMSPTSPSSVIRMFPITSKDNPWLEYNPISCKRSTFLRFTYQNGDRCWRYL
jgi:hypothetical protein